MKVAVTRKIPRIGIDALEDAGLEVVGNPTDRLLDPTELKDLIEGVEAILCLILDKVDGETMRAAGPGLKIIANFGMGFDNIDIEAARSRGIMVTNTPSERSARSVAEFAIGMVFALLKRIVEGDGFARKGNFGGWKPELFIGENLCGKTLGVVGLGRIGCLVAQMAKALGMRVVYYKRSRDFKLEADYDLEYMSFENVLREADVLTLHTPLTKETEHMINDDTLKQMKNTAYLINTSRGRIIDEVALVEALKNSYIAGAALDVFEYEPEINPELLGLPNVILTPHIASSVQEVRDEMALMAAKNVIEALSGRTPPNLVG